MCSNVVVMQVLGMELKPAHWFGEQIQDYVGVLLLERHRRRNSSRMQHAGRYDLAPCQHVTLFLFFFFHYGEQTCLAEHFSPPPSCLSGHTTPRADEAGDFPLGVQLNLNED